MDLEKAAMFITLSCILLQDNAQALNLMKVKDESTPQYEASLLSDTQALVLDVQSNALLLSEQYKRSTEIDPVSEASESQPITKVACSNGEKLFSKHGLIIVACLSCLCFLLLYMVILLMAVPRLCFPYHPDSKKMKQRIINMKNINNVNTDVPPKKTVGLPSAKINKSGRNDSGIESVDGLVTGCQDAVNGNEVSTFIDRLYDFEKSINRPICDDDLVGEERRPPNRMGMSSFNGKRPRSQSVAIMPSRYQSGIYIEL
ncbi:uncharacterized protein LOC115212938 [Argonauta hians]